MNSVRTTLHYCQGLPDASCTHHSCLPSLVPHWYIQRDPLLQLHTVNGATRFVTRHAGGVAL